MYRPIRSRCTSFDIDLDLVLPNFRTVVGIKNKNKHKKAIYITRIFSSETAYMNLNSQIAKIFRNSSTGKILLFSRGDP